MSEPTVRAATSTRYLTFTLAGELFALDIQDITEIIEFRTLTSVPMMPAFIRGVLNLRGRVLPVMDLAARFGREPTAVARRTSIIVVQTTAERANPESEDAEGPDRVTDIGIMVDGVNKVVHLGADDIEAAPAFGIGISSDFIAGMARHDSGFIIVLDIGKVLRLEDMVQLQQAVVSGTGGAVVSNGVGGNGVGGNGVVSGAVEVATS